MILHITTDVHDDPGILRSLMPGEPMPPRVGRIWLYRLGHGADLRTSTCELLALMAMP